MATANISKELIAAAAELRDGVDRLAFAAPVTHVYNPLDYAWRAHETFLKLHGNSRKKVLFLGMNPGPYGMAQTGVPFGEIAAVRDWIGINESVSSPKNEHPARPVEGFDCTRSEVSGRRLWGLFSQKYPDATDFFADHFVVNYCPLVFMEESGRNRTPDKLPTAEIGPLFDICDQHLKRVVEALTPEHLIGVGGFAEKCFRRIFGKKDPRIATILHPSPASPAANRGWAEAAEKKMKQLGIW
jgi:single-strand selective monofunctional uracil DNA glycosylase